MIAREGSTVRANGIDIHYVEAGAGPPLVLLHGGIVSTSPLWAGHPFAYVSHMETLGEHFRVIAPDTRGGGGTRHPGGPVTFDLLADDVLALIEALGLERPAVCGFSEGGVTAAIVGIRDPGSVRAIVNHAGHDLFNAEAPTFTMMRQALGGGPEATAPDPDAAARFFAGSEEMRATFELLRADQDDWREYVSLAFERTTRSPGYTFEDLGRIEARTLILTGDRDHFCSVEEGAVAYRALARGELAVLPDTGHLITGEGVRATLEFLRRISA